MPGCFPGPSVVVLDEKLPSTPSVRTSGRVPSADSKPGTCTADCEDVTEKPAGVAPTTEEAAQADSEQCLAAIGEQLMYAQSTGRLWRRRFQRPLLAAGAALCPSGGALLSIWLTSRVKALFSAGIVALGLGALALLLAILPTDRVAIKWAARAWLACGPLIVLQELFMMLRHAVIDCCDDLGVPIPRSVANAHVLISCTVMASWICIFCWLARRLGGCPARVLACVWKSCGAVCFVLAAYPVVNLPLVWPYNSGVYYKVHEAVMNPVLYFLLGLVCWCDAPRRRVQSYLASHAGQAAPVLQIAELLGQKPIPETLESAKATFRCVPGDCVTRDGLEHPSGASRLLNSTMPAQFGCVDAFVSHSWYDDPGKKWEALQEWRVDFRRRHGREPLLWVDRYCIDPRDLDEGLRCLPLYVVGCNTFLALCGPTYLERAWCLLEVFVFLAMGGRPENIEVQLFGPCTQDVARAIESFDAAQATCSFETDTARLQDVFTIGFSSAGSLTDAIKAVLRDAIPN